MTQSHEDFYVGYMPTAPTALGRWLQRTVLGVLVLALGTSVLLAMGQRTSDPAVYEFTPSTVVGRVRLTPHPHLVVRRPGQGAGQSTYLLTVFGKVGADEALQDYDDQLVSLSGSVIHRDEHVILELDPASIEVLDTGGGLTQERQDFGSITLEGEIVDAKCFLGVMKPGRGKIHKSCAIRCISGGVPPVLVVENGKDPDFLLLVDTEGHPVGSRVLDFIAETVRIQGHHERIGDMDVLRIDPAKIERMDPRVRHK
jgi:hypothetical protein